MKFLNKHWWLLQLDKLLKKPNVENGFIDEPLKEEDWKIEEFGADRKVLMAEDPKQGWLKYRPEPEEQKRSGSETMACVTFSAMNVLETIINYFYWLTTNGHADDEQKEIVKVFEYFGLIKDGKANFSDRFIAKMSNTTYRGNGFGTVASAIRKYGLVAEDLHPYVIGWSNYYSAVPQEVKDKGKKLLDFIEFTYEFVDPTRFNEMKPYGPNQTSVYAWNGRDVDGHYTRVSYSRNHAVDNDGFIQGQYDNIFDSYKPFDKKVAWNFNLGNGLLWTIHLKKKLCVYNEEAIQKLRDRGFKYIQRVEKQKGAHGEVYELTDRNTLLELSEQQKMEIGIRALADKKDATGISEDDYNSLFI